MSPVSDETEIGAYTYVGPAGEIGGAKIGRFCSIAPRVVIAPFEHPTDWLSSHPFQFGRSRKFKFWPEFSEFRFKQLPMKPPTRSEEHTSELQSLMRISYAVFCLKKKTQTKYTSHKRIQH